MCAHAKGCTGCRKTYFMFNQYPSHLIPTPESHLFKNMNASSINQPSIVISHHLKIKSKAPYRWHGLDRLIDDVPLHYRLDDVTALTKSDPLVLSLAHSILHHPLVCIFFIFFPMSMYVVCVPLYASLHHVRHFGQ